MTPYFALVSLCYLFGICHTAHSMRKTGRCVYEIGSVLFVAAMGSVFGAKWAHILLEANGHLLPDGSLAIGVLDLLKADPWHWARLFDPGYVFYGGVFGGVGLALLYLWTHRIHEPLRYLDAVCPSIAFGICVGRLACFVAGCCYGSPLPLYPWARHPTQLYDSLFGGVLFIALCLAPTQMNRPGQRFFGTMILYVLWRFYIENLRGDLERGLWYFWGLKLSSGQLISLALLPLLSFFYLRSSPQALDKGKDFGSYSPSTF
jgi:prolipoprotein diacylglyceryltransferase